MKRLLSLIMLAALLLTGCNAAVNTEDSEITDPTGSAAPPASVQPNMPDVPDAPDPIEEYMLGMTLEQKVGQLFIVAPEQFLSKYSTVTSVTDAIKEGMSQYPVGGIILFGDHIVSPNQLMALNRDLMAASDIPLFIAVDEEGGRVARLARNDAFNLPTYESAASVASSGDPEDVRNMGLTIGAYLKEYGFNLDFAPVADVNTNPKNTVIGTRAFSTDPVIAGKMAAAFAEGLGEKGIISTFKHFPGHGDTAEDSHSGLAVNHKDRESLEKCEWLTFREAKSTDMVMVGHIALPEVTGNMTPATMSREIVTEILKNDMGFSGLVITDSLQMGAITESYSSGEAALAALQAGCDILLMPENLPEAFDAVLTAVEDGTLNSQWLDATVETILRFKQIHGILTI